MKNFLLITFFCVLAAYPPAGTVFAGDGSHRAAAEKLLKAMDVEKTMMETIDKMVELEVAGSPQLTLYQDVMRKFFEKHMTGEVMFEAMAAMYMEEFTEQELNELAAFYTTDIGRKSIEKLPIMTKKGALWAQQQVTDNLQELQMMIVAETRRLQQLKKNTEQ